MAGVSLRGTVEKREKESVYLKLDIDGADGKALHPYPWIPPTGNVMYCMPQEGTEAYLYFPEAEEESAYAVSEIHNSRCPVFADAQRRELVTEHWKKLRLHAAACGHAWFCRREGRNCAGVPDERRRHTFRCGQRKTSGHGEGADALPCTGDFP